MLEVLSRKSQTYTETVAEAKEVAMRLKEKIEKEVLWKELPWYSCCCWAVRV